MRVVHAAGYGSAVPGSFIAGLRAVFTLVRERGWEAELVLPEQARSHAWVRTVADEGVTVRFVDRGRRAAIRELAQARGAGARILHTHYTSFDVAAAVSRPSQRSHVVWHIRTRPQRSWPNPHDAVKFGLLGRLTDRVLCSGPQISSDVVERGAPRGRVHAVRNGIDLEHFRPAEAGERAAARKVLGLRADGLVLLHLGHHPHLKATDRVVALARELPEATVLIVAAPPAGRSDRGGIRYLEPVADTRPLYLAADALVAPSRSEGGDPPYALAEALACGTPIVGSDIAGHRRLNEMAPAVLLSPASPRDLADAVRRLPPPGDESFARAQAWVAANFSVERYAKEIMRHYDDIAGR
jgi:glycosyltransferase involved in cell wall biosynthesis